ncbi:Ferric-chelate reductase 1 [Auxenochlorella protothecoides]|uniref:Ferric-chelate reductase 1 n=1 Tax=Auxenochlorella protothecoides TaxID=3075 RepID=A0A087SQG7_AUXPR|nr:Ferric-chelate reductase 1 [Auxenochlorella protothecoides]KFM27971.1 Ferric-chelate reductase 1 [Auxenochlorella protothecoides]
MLSPVTTNYRRSESKLRFAYFEDPRDAALWTSGQKPVHRPGRVAHIQQYHAATGTWSAVVEAPGPVSSVTLLKQGVRVAHRDLKRDAAGLASGVLVVSSGSTPTASNSRHRKEAERMAARTASSRRLLATSDCTLDISGTAHSFTACQSVATGFTVYTALEAGVGGAAVLRAGVSADASGGWAGFGVSADQSMVGGHVGVVAVDSGAASGASVSGYTLPSYTASRVNAAKGSLTLSDTSAIALSDGTLRATWSFPLNQTLAEAEAAETGFIYAIGPLAGAGVLGSHITTLSCRLVGLSSGAGEEFGSCASLPSFGSGLNLFWTAREASGSNAATVTWGMNTSASDGWVAVGFPASPGEMVGANAAILSSCPTCASGVRLEGYYLAGTSQADVQPPSRIQLSDISASRLDGGGMAGAFTVTLATSGTARRRGLLTLGTQPIIVASGPVGADGSIQQHDLYGASTVNLADGGSASVDGTSDDLSLIKVHAALLTVGWGILIPTGILLARSFKRHDPLWFYGHIAVQTLGLALGIAGVGIGFHLVGGWTAPNDTVQTHRDLGVTILVLGVVQFLLALTKPHKEHRRRGWWNLVHKWLGRAVVIIAIANIYYGYIRVYDLGVWPYATYSGVLGLILLVGLVREVQLRRESARLRVSASGQFLATQNALAMQDERESESSTGPLKQKAAV